MASSPEENLKEMKQRRRKATNFDRNSSSTCIEKIPEKKNGKYIRNKNKTFAAHTERDNLRGLPFFFFKLKKKEVCGLGLIVSIYNHSKEMFFKKNDVVIISKLK
jgi:hypothetical protein